MTWAAMKVDPAETARRQEVCTRLNILDSKRNRAEDEKTRKRITRKMDVIRRQEAPWLKDIAYWLY